MRGRGIDFQLSIRTSFTEHDAYPKPCCAYERFRSFQDGSVYQSYAFEHEQRGAFCKKQWRSWLWSDMANPGSALLYTLVPSIHLTYNYPPPLI